MKLKVNDQIPDIKIFHLVDGEPKEQNISEVLGSKKIVYLVHLQLHALNFIYQVMLKMLNKF